MLWKVISLEYLLTWWALDILSVSPPDISRIGTKLGDFTGYWLYSGTNLYNNGGKEIQFIGRQSQSVITLSVTLSEQVSGSVVIASYLPQAGWSACPVCLVRPAGHRFWTTRPSWLDFNKTNKCWTTNYITRSRLIWMWVTNYFARISSYLVPGFSLLGKKSVLCNTYATAKTAPAWYNRS